MPLSSFSTTDDGFFFKFDASLKVIVGPISELDAFISIAIGPFSKFDTFFLFLLTIVTNPLLFLKISLLVFIVGLFFMLTTSLSSLLATIAGPFLFFSCCWPSFRT